MEYKLPKRLDISNKSTYGKVLNIAGSDYMSGAAYLSSVSALKVGCGYCFLASTEKSISSVSAKTSNVVFLPLKDIKRRLKEFDVVEIGCGLSQAKWSTKIFNTVITNLDKKTPLIIDADGLNILSKDPKNFINKGFKNIILTPHPKEAARLLGCELSDILSDTTQNAIKISQKYNCITVLKTHNTVVASKAEETYYNTTGNNAMAKAGSGDVLTGIISGLVAQKMELFQAAALGTYLHGLCGDIAKEKLTEYSVMAEDLISNIPNAIKLYLVQN
jgi:NAD(P)H-hydrate epimerase